jgi:hypothetical protein
LFYHIFRGIIAVRTDAGAGGIIWKISFRKKVSYVIWTAFFITAGL